MIKDIVLLHGWGANTQKLAPLAKELKKMGWQPYTLKLPGFDLPLNDANWTLERYAKFIDAEISARYGSTPVVVFGHSFGGRILLKLLSDKFNSQIQGAVLNSASGLSRDTVFKRLPLLVVSKATKFTMRLPVVGSLASKLNTYGQRRYYKNAQGNLKQVFQSVIRQDLKPLVSKIKIPVLVIWGEQDRLTPFKDAKYLAAHLPRCESVSYPDGDHLLVYSKPDKLAQNITTWAKRI